MKTLILLEKRTYLLRLLDLFKQKPELSLKEIKQKIPSTSYYRDLLSRIFEINNILHGQKPGYFIQPTFLKNGSKIISGLRKHPDIKTEVKEGFVVLSYEKDQKN